MLLAWLASRLVRRLTSRVLEGIVGDTIAPTSPLVRGPLRLVAAVAFLLALGIILVPAFEIVELRPRTGITPEDAGDVGL